jgi:hypothetical protein
MQGRHPACRFSGYPCPEFRWFLVLAKIGKRLFAMPRLPPVQNAETQDFRIAQ